MDASISWSSDLSKAVSLANLLVRLRRVINWIHMPVLIDRKMPLFRPLKEPSPLAGTELYLGSCMQKMEWRCARRMQMADQFVQDFGIATECGIGRSRTPEMVEALMRIHAAALKWAFMTGMCC